MGFMNFQTIDPGITPAASPSEIRALAVSEFPSDPVGTLYAGGIRRAWPAGAQHRLGSTGAFPKIETPRVKSPQRSVRDGALLLCLLRRRDKSTTAIATKLGVASTMAQRKSNSGASPRSLLCPAPTFSPGVFRH